VSYVGGPSRKYLFLAYRDEEQWQALSSSERDTFMSACQVSEQELQQSGHLFALQTNNTALTVRFQNGQVSLTDSLYGETDQAKVQLFFIKARDLNEAIQLAAKMPQARRGFIEVRSVIEAT